MYLYRAVDKYGKTIDFLSTKQRDKAVTRPMLGFKSFDAAQSTLAI